MYDDDFRVSSQGTQHGFWTVWLMQECKLVAVWGRCPCPQCPPVAHMIYASFAHINVIALPHTHFPFLFSPKYSVVLRNLQQFAFPWAVGTQRPKALHFLLHGCMLHEISAFLDQAERAVAFPDRDLGVSIAKIPQICRLQVQCGLCGE